MNNINPSKKHIFFLLIISIVLSCISCSDTHHIKNTSADVENINFSENKMHDAYLSDAPEKPTQKEAETYIEGLVNQMSLDEKVYQLFFTVPEDITGVGCVIAAGDATKKALSEYPVGGIIYFSSNFESRKQTSEMITNTQSFASIPLFIAVDEEGGVVSRLGTNPEMKTTPQPPMMEIGETQDASEAYSAGKQLAIDLKSLGFNVDFAPVADVLINSDNVEIGNRSFGSDPNLVGEMVSNLVKGLEENGISSTLKHFPGHGSTTVDSHTGYSASTRTKEELKNCEFIPFKMGIDAGADFIMISGMTLVNATDEKIPCSLSKEVVTDMLIDELGYKGIIITDSFKMGAITEQYSSSDAAVKAILAGVDMILMPENLAEAHAALITAVQNGIITEDRIDLSVKKILLKKLENGILTK